MAQSSRVARLLGVTLIVSSSAIAGWQETKETKESEKKKDKDSIELVVTGCLKGRALQAEEVRPTIEGDDIPVIQARAFRVNGAREILDEIKKQNNRYVEATGRVKRSSLLAAGPGIDVGRARITVTPGAMGDPSRAPQYTTGGVVHLDVTAVRMVSESCSGR
ncbi:MAG TPA: hypothetical protein VHI98_26300 [Vicinamibacterales bacterium]|jgi:hypothetical protein|nr:hypothetical protein [Vicinamibacterales bacterium]